MLTLIAEHPRHGYELMQAIADKTGGVWQPSPGSVYPTLAKLQDEGLISSTPDANGRDVATLTDKGTNYVETNRELLDSVWTTVSVRADSHNLYRAAKSLTTASRQVSEVGTSGQIEAAVEVIERARRELYAILAADPIGAAVSESQ